MSVLPTSDALIRFNQNEDRINTFVNAYGTYSTNSGLPDVETIPSFMQRMNYALNISATTNVRGAWAANTAYNTWDEVQYSGTWYRCVVAHTSSTSFDSTKFRISQGVRAGDLASSTGASMVGYGTTTVKDIVDSISLTDYAALRSYSGQATNVYVSGYSTSSTPSGIAGNFTYDPTDTTSADNGGTIIVSTSGKRWKRIINYGIEPIWFGAKFDGTTDDTSAWNAAISFAKSINSFIAFRRGKTFINGTVNLLDTVSIFGAGKTASEIYFGVNGKFSLSGTSSALIGRFILKDFGLTNQGGGATTCLSLLYATRVVLDNCVVYNSNINFQAFTYLSVINCDLFGGVLNCGHPTTNQISDTLKMTNINASGYTISMRQTADVNLSQVTLLGATAQINYQRGSMPSNFYPPFFMNDCVIDSGDNEGLVLVGVVPHLRGVFVSCGRTTNTNGISLADCIDGAIVDLQSRYNGLNGISLSACKNLTFSGSSFNDNKQYGVRLADSCTDIRFIGCSMINDSTWFGGNFPQVQGIVDQTSNCSNIYVIGCNVTGNTGGATYLPSATNVFIGNDGVGIKFQLVTTVASLPSAVAVGEGARANVNDATSTTFFSVVAGGGSNHVPVYSDGTTWRIG